MRGINQDYQSKCLNRLKEWGAPLEGWQCVKTYDVFDGNSNTYATCELCHCEKVRFVHIMRHEDFYIDIHVGCICAGIMEGNILAARERERIAKNRSKRKQHFPHRKWKTAANGDIYLTYKGLQLIINQCTSDLFCVQYGGQTIFSYKGKTIKDQLSAVYAAFDLVDPPMQDDE
jgi:hypothetical protein